MRCLILILFEQAEVDGFAHGVAEDEKDNQEADETAEEDDDALGIDVLDFIAGVLRIGLGVRVRCWLFKAHVVVRFGIVLPRINGHVPAP